MTVSKQCTDLSPPLPHAWSLQVDKWQVKYRILQEELQQSRDETKGLRRERETSSSGGRAGSRSSVGSVNSHNNNGAADKGEEEVREELKVYYQEHFSLLNYFSTTPLLFGTCI